MIHPYTFFASLEKDVEKLPPHVKPTAASWLDAFWRGDLFVNFKSALRGVTSPPALNIIVGLDGVGLETESGMVRFWTYELFGYESNVQLGLRQAAALVGYAIKTLKDRDKSAQKIITAYFGAEEHGNWNLAANQFEGIRNALMQKFIVVMKGEKAEDSVAYVHPGDDYQALYGTQSKISERRYRLWSEMQRGNNIGFVSVKDRLFDSPSADRGGGLESTSNRSSAEHAMCVGITLVHEISHLFATERTDDIPLAMIMRERLKDFPFKSEAEKKLSSKILECYGRILCKALAWTRPSQSYKNADTLAFFALDAWMLRQKPTSLEEILQLS